MQVWQSSFPCEFRGDEGTAAYVRCFLPGAGLIEPSDDVPPDLFALRYFELHFGFSTRESSAEELRTTLADCMQDFILREGGESEAEKEGPSQLVSSLRRVADLVLKEAERKLLGQRTDIYARTERQVTAWQPSTAGEHVLGHEPIGSIHPEACLETESA